MRDIVLDSGAFLALERGDRQVRSLIDASLLAGHRFRTSSAAVAQIWRGGARQTQVARLLSAEAVIEVPLDAAAAREVGMELGARSLNDVVDCHVALIARQWDANVLTSDPGDLEALGINRERILPC